MSARASEFIEMPLDKKHLINVDAQPFSTGVCNQKFLSQFEHCLRVSHMQTN